MGTLPIYIFNFNLHLALAETLFYPTLSETYFQLFQPYLRYTPRPYTRLTHCIAYLQLLQHSSAHTPLYPFLHSLRNLLGNTLEERVSDGPPRGGIKDGYLEPLLILSVMVCEVPHNRLGFIILRPLASPIKLPGTPMSPPSDKPDLWTLLDFLQKSLCRFHILSSRLWVILPPSLSLRRDLIHSESSPQLLQISSAPFLHIFQTL